MDINIDNYDLISFDIFDTLLLRAVSKPIEVFNHIWERAKKEEICMTDISPTEFMKLRVEMEHRARGKASGREVNLDEIYNELPNQIVTDVKRLKNLELVVEKECCYPNYTMYELVKSAKRLGKKVVLLSDMYLSKEQIIMILEHNKIDTAVFDGIFISNEMGCTKQDGGLYEILLNDWPQIEKTKILHIGDNENSDYVKAINAGIQAVHYDVIREKVQSIYDYEKIRHDTPQREILSLRKIAAESATFENQEEKALFEIGASIVGPFLSLYVSWVCNRLKKLNITRVYPFMREGYLLGELLKRQSEHVSQRLLVKPIYISRKVTYIPSIERINREEIENMIGARNLTVKESIILMGLKKEDFPEVLDYLDISLKESHTVWFRDNLTLKEHMINRFLEVENCKKIEDYIKEERALLNSYLKQEIGDFNNIATMDIGFFGRIQQWMEKSLNMDMVPHNMKHFLAIGLTGNKVFDGMNFEGCFGTFAENQDLISTIHRTTDILEKLISVTEGSTIGYQEENEKIIPIKSEGVNNTRFKEIIFQGIFEFQKLWFQFQDSKPEIAFQCIENRRETLMIIHRLIDMPRYVEAELLGNLNADTNFGTNYIKSIITKDNMKLLEEKGVDYIDKCNISYSYENSNIVWPKGLITLKDEFYYVRRALKSNAGNEITKAMQELVEQIVENGLKEVALYGAGENGRQFYFICKLYHVKVTCFIDRKESLWGSKKEGIEIIGLHEAMERGIHSFIVTSLFSISEIENYIRDSFEVRGEKAFIFHV